MRDCQWTHRNKADVEIPYQISQQPKEVPEGLHTALPWRYRNVISTIDWAFKLHGSVTATLGMIEEAKDATVAPVEVLSCNGGGIKL
jgi:hypothetical protein